MEWLWLNISIIVLLTVLGIVDIKRRSITIIGPVFIAMLGTVSSIINRRNILDIILSLSIGILFFAISYITREAFGKGDCYVISALAFCLNIEDLIMLISIALLGSSVIGLVMICMGKHRGYSIPFIPFLLLGYILVLAGD